MEEKKKLKHLEFLEDVITRMNFNSFLIKGWAITLVAALFALAAKDANIRYVLIPYFVLPVFWVLDGYYVATERRYRDVYNEVRGRSEAAIDFDMDASRFKRGRGTWLCGMFSQTLLLFYGIAVLVTVGVMFVLEGE